MPSEEAFVGLDGVRSAVECVFEAHSTSEKGTGANPVFAQLEQLKVSQKQIIQIASPTSSLEKGLEPAYLYLRLSSFV